MKKILAFGLMLSATALCTTRLSAQDLKRAQFVYSGIETREQYAQLAQDISALPAVKNVRIDQQHRNGFIELKEGQTLQESALREICEAHSVNVLCFVINDVIPGNITFLNPKDCAPEALPAVK